jgi:secreted trypsin-like serine protease
MHRLVPLILISISRYQSADIRSLIVPGPISASSEYPFTAAILSCSRSSSGYLACGCFCSGSLIAPNLVLTAGHCVYDETSAFDNPQPPVPLNQMYVLLGSNDSRQSSTGDVVVKVESFTNKGYGMNLRYPMDGDFAILKLSDCVELVPGKIETVRVATLDNEPITTSSTCTDIVTIGFGRITNLPEDVAYSDGKLRKLPDALHTFDTCLNAYIGDSLLLNGQDASYLNRAGNEGLKAFYETYLVPEYNACVGGNSVHSSCNGDSGGPIVARGDNGSYIQIGTTSFGTGSYCGYGADYITRLAPSADFIRQIMDSNTGKCPNWSVQSAFSSWPPRVQTSSEISEAFQSSRCPSSSQWQCEDGACIQRSQVCDNVIHCPDGSDETRWFCSFAYGRSSTVRSATGGLTQKQSEIQSELDKLIAEAESQPVPGGPRLLGEADEPTVLLLGPLTSFGRPIPKVPGTKAEEPPIEVVTNRPVIDRIGLRANNIDCSSIAADTQAAIDYEQQYGYNRLEQDPSSMITVCSNYLDCVESGQSSPVSGIGSFCYEFAQFVSERQQALDGEALFDSRYNNQCAEPPSEDSTVHITNSGGNTQPISIAKSSTSLSMFSFLFCLVVAMH